MRVATHMWPGSEANIGGEIEPSYIDKYNGSEVLNRKVDRILEFLDKPGPNSESAMTVEDQRPQLVLAYVPNVDSDGHKYGPNSTEIRTTISNADMMMGYLLSGLQNRNLTDVVNIVVVSDHGMATTSYTRTIQFEDLIDPSLIERIDGWPHYGLRPFDTTPENLEKLHQQLLAKTAGMDGFDVYTKDTMPDRYHFAANPRIAPLWLIPRTGWSIVTKDEFDVASAQRTGEVYHPRGIHGYDHEHPLMRAIFIARGPAFPHMPGSRVDVFQNVEVYNILCDSVGVTPKANNGTLRLPFRTSGVHGEDVFEGEVVEDLPDSVTSPLKPTATSTEILAHDPSFALTPSSTPSPSTTPPTSSSIADPMTSATQSSTAASPSPSGTAHQFHDHVESENTDISALEGLENDQFAPNDKGEIVAEDVFVDENGNIEVVELTWKEWFKQQVDALKDWADETLGMNLGGKGRKGEDEEGVA